MKEFKKLIVEYLNKENILVERRLDPNLERYNDELFQKLVARDGKSDTVEGEMLRAINKIMYRYSNDGDYYFDGYGTETAGSAHAYLIKQSPLKNEIIKILPDNYDVCRKMKDEGPKQYTESDLYNNRLEQALKLIIEYILSKDGNYTSNSIDMLDADPVFDKSRYDEDDDYEDEDY